jgi:hypothetical protein
VLLGLGWVARRLEDGRYLPVPFGRPAVGLTGSALGIGAVRPLGRRRLLGDFDVGIGRLSGPETAQPICELASPLLRGTRPGARPGSRSSTHRPPRRDA